MAAGRRERPLIFGIETSCDDTACAVVDGAGRVLASVVSSQLAAHRPYGGVVPEIASREHLKNWRPVSERALARAGIALAEVDAVAATRGPGLIGCLLVGLSLGKALAYGLGKPFYAVHHLEGHLYSPFLPPPPAAGANRGANSGELADAEPPPAEPVPERFVGLVVSGGHTNLFAVEYGRVETLAETRDDAIGEVFDKVGKRLGLPYPQGPRVDELAEAAEMAGGAGGGVEAPRFAVAACSDESLDFSYSGLKSQVLLAIEGLERRGIATRLGGEPTETDTKDAGGQATAAEPRPEPPPEVGAILAAFRRAAVAQLLDRLDRLHRRRPIELLAVSGGVAANRLLRREAAAWAAASGVALRQVPLAYSGDNAAMIAHAALLRHRRGDADDPFAAEAASRITI